jgi:hypothetical protein
MKPTRARAISNELMRLMRRYAWLATLLPSDGKRPDELVLAEMARVRAEILATLKSNRKHARSRPQL